MATTQVTITQTAQQVSAGACMMQSNKTFEYGFGVLEPTIFFTKVMSTKKADILNYAGTYGAIWVKVPTNEDNDTLTVVTV